MPDEYPGLEQLRRSEQLFARAFIANPVPMSITNAETQRFTAANDEFLRLTGFYRAEVIGRTSEELKLWPARDERDNIGRRLESTEIAGPFTANVRVKNGQLVKCRISFRLLTLPNEPSILTVLVPTT